MVTDRFIGISEAPDDLPQQTLDSRYPPPQKTTAFFWVNDQGNKDPSHVSSRRKQSFVRTRSHRRRKETQLKRLKESLKPFPGFEPSFTDYRRFQSEERDENEIDRHAPVLSRSLQATLGEAFSSLPRYTNFKLHQSKSKNIKFDGELPTERE